MHCVGYGSARKSYLQMLYPIHNQGLRLCLGAFRTIPLESLYVDAHEPSLGVRRARLSLQYASKIKSLPKHPAHNAVFDNKYMKLFDARTSAIRTFGLRIKQFLIASNIMFFWHFGNTFVFYLPTLVCQTTEDCAGFGASEKRSNRCNFSWKFETSTVITFLFIQTDHGMGMLWYVLRSFHRTPNYP